MSYLMLDVFVMIECDSECYFEELKDYFRILLVLMDLVFSDDVVWCVDFLCVCMEVVGFQFEIVEMEGYFFVFVECYVLNDLLMLFFYGYYDV